MTMSKEQICSDYRQAKQKMKQIGILADLNCCKRFEIVDILVEAGEEIPKNYQKKPTRKTTPARASTVAAHRLTAGKLMDLLSGGFGDMGDIEIMDAGNAVRYVNFSGVYDVQTGKTEWVIDLVPEKGA